MKMKLQTDALRRAGKRLNRSSRRAHTDANVSATRPITHAETNMSRTECQLSIGRKARHLNAASSSRQRTDSKIERLARQRRKSFSDKIARILCSGAGTRAGTEAKPAERTCISKILSGIARTRGDGTSLTSLCP